MLIAGVNGSPNSKGNTGTLIAQVLSGAASRGADTVVFDLGRMDFKPCRACMACKSGKPCTLKDDMYTFYDRAADLDALVVGAPIYLDHITAQTKAWLDRLYCYIGPDLEDRYPGGKKAVTCITYGDGGAESYDDVLDWMKGRLKFYWGIETIGTLKKAGCPEDVIVDKDEALMKEAFRLGVELAGA